MIEMIDNFVFDYEDDTYRDQDGIQLSIDYDIGVYHIRFESTTSKGCKNAIEDCLFKKIVAKTYEEAVLKIRDILRTEEYAEWKRKICGWKEPTTPSEDKIKELIRKSDSAELKYLQNETSYLKDKTKELEKRIEIVENSVEDLENWRHS
jgi:hypothetical protein